MNDFSEKGADRRFEYPTWYIFQFKYVKDKSSRIKIVLAEELLLQKLLL